jgi:DNA-binding GntR family transcriptional regulator
MKFKRAPIVQPRLAIDVYEQILYAIVNGQFKPGERLIQEQIAEEINVSRTPVREALLRLEQEGVLVQTGRKGFSIRNISDEEVRSLYGVREAIEGYAAYHLAADRSPEKLAIIKASVDAELVGGEQTLEEEFIANKDIHRLVVEQVGNPALLDMFDNIWNRGISLWLFAATRGDEASVQPEVHVDLYNVIATGTPEEAHTEMIRHVRAGLSLHLSDD